MLRDSKRRRNLPLRIFRAIKRELSYGGIYGLEWGDPDLVPPLGFIRDRYLLPYVNEDHCAVEIGPGGGRWTRYLLGFKKLYIVDYYSELLEEAERRFRRPDVIFIKNNGTDFPGIGDHCVDYLFSFGTFVHLDTNLIEGYLNNMRRILKARASVVLHYSDKTKVMAQINDGFAENTPEKMRSMVLAAGYKICEEDVHTMWHSSIIRFTL
jgi:ubiquinone/menaquinone biosynthesis C-methylase UbiE